MIGFMAKERSSKTMNLCSKCFADFQKKQPDDDSAPSTSNSQSDLFSEETTSDNSNTSITTPTRGPSQQPLLTELNVTSPGQEECGPCTDTAHVSLITPTKRSCGTDSQSENEASPVKRPRLLEATERSEETTRSKQKNRRRCYQCQTKLELVQQELGSCRCEEGWKDRPKGSFIHSASECSILTGVSTMPGAVNRTTSKTQPLSSTTEIQLCFWTQRYSPGECRCSWGPHDLAGACAYPYPLNPPHCSGPCWSWGRVRRGGQAEPVAPRVQEQVAESLCWEGGGGRSRDCMGLHLLNTIQRQNY
ncbi:AN1-type zinc finger protein 3 isoform X2 [Tamandua tetradactyla]|uniref:AN1-type zinc finger protein 3 isoform X2 n=1 Tax=Tamandua tetradactyla TaxID=48850 RepID=UPI00405427D2